MRKKFTDADDALIREYYSSRIGMPIELDKLASSMSRTRWSVAMRASRMGLGSYRRVRSDKHKNACSIAQKIRGARPDEIKKRSEDHKRWHELHKHPKGMLGKHHSQKSKDAISAFHLGKPQPIERTIMALKTKLAKYGTLATNVKRGSWKAAWREIGGFRKFYRSRWEANYARYLEFQKGKGLIKKWQHECETFWFDGIKRGCVSYLPDFKVTNNDGSIEYHEVKGWMDAASKTKIKRMAKYHPNINLMIFDSKWYKANSHKLSSIIPDWE